MSHGSSLGGHVSAFEPPRVCAPPFRVSPTPDGLVRWDSEGVMRSILVVDDDEAVRGLIVRILRSGGHVVVGEAGSVAEALDLAELLRPGIALVDIGLPDGDGFSLTRQLRAQPWGIEVVLFSSDGDRTNADAARRAGAVGFLPKDELSSSALERLIGDRADEDS